MEKLMINHNYYEHTIGIREAGWPIWAMMLIMCCGQSTAISNGQYNIAISIGHNILCGKWMKISMKEVEFTRKLFYNRCKSIIVCICINSEKEK